MAVGDWALDLGLERVRAGLCLVLSRYVLDKAIQTTGLGFFELVYTLKKRRPGVLHKHARATVTGSDYSRFTQKSKTTIADLATYQEPNSRTRIGLSDLVT